MVQLLHPGGVGFGHRSRAGADVTYGQRPIGSRLLIPGLAERIAQRVLGS